MDVKLNGQPIACPEGTSLLKLLQMKDLNPETVVVEYNRQIVSREQWGHIVLKDEDALEVLHFVGGG